MSPVHVIEHPLVQHKLSLLRDRRTPTRDFRQVLKELAMLMAYEVTRDLALVALLVAYFLAWPASPALFALALFGLPVGFGLMLLHVVLGAVRRSRP